MNQNEDELQSLSQETINLSPKLSWQIKGKARRKRITETNER